MGRTSGIISRLPYFYRSGERYNNLYQFLEVFGSLLDEAESDLVRVLHARWVNTANNLDSQGFDTGQKGDLDKIFSLYLENLGGTSLLRQLGRPTEDDEAYQTKVQELLTILTIKLRRTPSLSLTEVIDLMREFGGIECRIQTSPAELG